MTKNNYIYHSPSVNKEYIDENDNEILSFGPISNINILIGANNSRKSRLLRTILTNDLYISEFNFGLIDKEINECLEKIKAKVSPYIDILEFKIPQSYDNIKDHENNEDLKPVLELFNTNKGQLLKFQIHMFDHIKVILNDYKEKPYDFEDFKKKILKNYNIIGSLIAYCKYKDDVLIRKWLFFEFNLKKQIDDELNELFIKFYKLLNIIYSKPLIQKKLDKKYIPLLRNAFSFYDDEKTDSKFSDIRKKITSNFFKITIEQHYNIKSTQENKIKIFTGLDFYDIIKKNRNDKKAIRNMFSKFEDFLKIHFFENKDVDIVAIIEEDETKQHIQLNVGDNEEDKDLHNLGDGLQSIIMLLYPIFMAEPNSWIFIEEPEMNLHPGFQHLFLKTILTDPILNEKNLTYFLTTHSNHLLSLSTEFNDKISIFSFKKNKDIRKSNIKKIFGNETDVLNMLGVFNTSVFMANCSIWVEGISDRRYIKAYLKAYLKATGKKEFLEDLHYAFFEYAGSNIEHYLFSDEDASSTEKVKIKAHFLSNRIFLLADQDNSTSKEARHEFLKTLRDESNGKFECDTTVAREIENTLPVLIIKKFLIEELKLGEEFVNKKKFDEKEYEDKLLGNFLKTKYSKSISSFPKIAKDGGTLTTYYKNKLSDFVLKQVETEKINWEMIKINKHAERITEEIYRFIERQNKL